MNTRRAFESRARRQAGLSVVELMVALALGLLVTAGLLQVFQTSKISYNTNDAIARVQENGRFAMEVLKRQLRESGTHGFCAARLNIRNHLNQSCGGAMNTMFSEEQSVLGWEFGGTGPGDSYEIPADLDPAGASAGEWDSSIAGGGSLPAMLGGEVAPGSDVLIVRRMEVVPGITGDGSSAASDQTINLSASHNLEDDTLVLVTNCASAADLFQNRTSSGASEFSKSGGSCSSPGPGNDGALEWSTAYDTSMQAFRVVTTAYYVGADAEGNPGLYQMDLGAGTSGATGEELVRGVESFQLQFGFSRAAPNGDGQSINDWLRADQVPADGWPQVLAVRVGVSIRSDEIADGVRESQTFNLAGTDVDTQDDGRMRHAFSTTLAMRNRVLVF